MAIPSAAADRDNLLGVCAALGEDFGFDPIYPRVALAALLLWSAKAAIAIYLVAGLVVLASRLLFPNARRRPVALVAVEAPAADEVPYRQAA